MFDVYSDSWITISHKKSFKKSYKAKAQISRILNNNPMTDDMTEVVMTEFDLETVLDLENGEQDNDIIF